MSKSRILVFLVASVALSSVAAADGYEYEPVGKGFAPRPVFSWTGFYVGLNGGYAWNETDASSSGPPGFSGSRAVADGLLNGDVDGGGFTGGITIGGNHQAGSLVIGVEGDFNYLDIDETRDTGIVNVGFNEFSIGRGRDRLDADWLATLRLRWGVATAQTLYYVTGGAAFTDASITRTLDWAFTNQCPLVGAGLQRCHAGSDDFHVGWTAGAGIEHAFTKNWTIKAEYLYADFGQEEFTTRNAGSFFPEQQINHSFDLDMHIVRTGVNYKF